MNNKEKLSKKVEKEYTNFIEELKDKPPQNIIDKCYEKTLKEEMKDKLQCMELNDIQISALLCQGNILSEFYEDWLHNDLNINEILEISMEDSIEHITSYHNKER